MKMLYLSRATVIQRCKDLDADADYLDDEDQQDYDNMSDDNLIAQYCLSGMFGDDHPGTDEKDIAGLK